MASADRLSELGAEDEKANDSGRALLDTASNTDIDEYMRLYTPVTNGVNQITNNLENIKKFKDQESKVTSEKQRREVLAQLERLNMTTISLAGQVKGTLDAIKASNDAFAKKGDNEGSAKARIREGQHTQAIRNFHKLMSDYNELSMQVKTSLQERSRRQLKAVNPDFTEQELDKLVASGSGGELMRKVLVTKHVKDTVKDIEARHEDIKKLEQQVLEVHELFQDLATLVDLQQESLDVIEAQLGKAKVHTDRGQKSLQEGEKYQQKARQKQCCLLFVILGVLIAIMAPVISSVASNS